MELALVRHQIGRDVADLNAVHHQTEMLRSHMFAAKLEAFCHGGGEAHGLALETGFDAVLGLLAELVHG